MTNISYKIILTLTLWLLCFYSSPVYGQTFSIPIGSELSNEGASTIVKGPSGDYYIAGYVENEGLLSRVSSDGELVWSKSIDFGLDPDYIMELELTSDNYIIGCGNSRTVGSSNLYGFIFKVSLDGDLIWSRQISAEDNYIWTRGLIEAENGNYRVFGGYRQVNLNNYVVEFDQSDGSQIWDTIYVKSDIYNGWDEDFYDGLTHLENDASYFGGRFETAAGLGTYRPSLTKLSSEGSLEWSKTYLYNSDAAGGRFYCTGLEQDGDALILSLLCKDGGTGTPFETGLIKTDLDGNIAWAKLYSSPGLDLRSFSMVSSGDGYVICGWEETGDKSLFMIKTDLLGNVVWSKTYGAGGDEDVKNGNSNSLIIIDGDYIVTVSRTASFSASDDVFLIKADLETGELDDIGCFDNLSIITESLPTIEFDYALETFNLPMVSTNPAMPMDDLDFESNSGILDFVADTLVSGDTIYLCSDDPFVFYADWSASLNFLWNTGGTDQLETVTETGTYWVDVSSDDGCLLWSDTVSIIFNALEIDLGGDAVICDDVEYELDAGFFEGAIFEWNDGSTDQTLLVIEDGEYWVTVTMDGCVGSDTVSVSFDSVELNLGVDTLICFGESILLDAENPGAVYEWNDGSAEQTLLADETGWYWVEINIGGCIRIDSFMLVVSDIMVNLPDDLILCIGESILLDAGVIAGTYLWNDGSTDQTFFVDSDGTYSVTVSDGDCSHSDEVEVLFFRPIASLQAEPLSGCVPLMVDFYDLSTTSLGIINSWYWNFGDGASSILENPIHTYTIPGIFDVSLIINTNYGCGDDTLITNYITTSEGVVADFSFSPDYVTADDVVNFTSLSINATSWHWDFGDGNFSTDENPEHKFNGTGEFVVTLTAMNASGCNESITKIIIIRDAVYIYVPNVFTPDGDNFNEVWRPVIYGIDIYDFHLIVFNRWGEIIWESYNSSAGWNGFYGDHLVQDGVYVWVMEYGDRFDDTKTSINGHVTILK